VLLAPGYRELAPPPPLRDALACLWVRVTPPSGGRPTRVLPDACVDLVWRLGEGAFVAGPDTSAKLFPSGGEGVLVGARFAPGAGGAALGLPLTELRDRRVGAADLGPELAEELPGELEPGEALQRMLEVATRRVDAGAPDVAVREAARRLSEPRARVEWMAAELGLSERQLRRRCHAAVGYGPKTLHRVLRFRRFLTRADAGGPHADLVRLALEAGFADQAHLTRECTRLTGLSPAALGRSRAVHGV
jgi:AraC-like DNA-binding protein